MTLHVKGGGTRIQTHTQINVNESYHIFNILEMTVMYGGASYTLTEWGVLYSDPKRIFVNFD